MSVTLGVQLAALLACGVAEYGCARREPAAAFASRWIGNCGLGLASRGLFWAIPAAWTAWASSPVLTLHRWPTSTLAGIALAVLAIDLVAYALHRLAHAVPLLWRVHAVHHSDVEMDFTTVLRNHPLEGLLIGMPLLVAVTVLGIGPDAVLAYGALRVAVQTVAHANIALPERVERLLGYVIVTPAFHGVHHASERPYTDSNFGELFSFWDRMLGTARVLDEQRIVFGLEYFRDGRSQQLVALLVQPFRRVGRSSARRAPA